MMLQLLFCEALPISIRILLMDAFEDSNSAPPKRTDSIPSIPSYTDSVLLFGDGQTLLQPLTSEMDKTDGGARMPWLSSKPPHDAARQ